MLQFHCSYSSLFYSYFILKRLPSATNQSSFMYYSNATVTNPTNPSANRQINSYPYKMTTNLFFCNGTETFSLKSFEHSTLWYPKFSLQRPQNIHLNFSLWPLNINPSKIRTCNLWFYVSFCDHRKCISEICELWDWNMSSIL